MWLWIQLAFHGAHLQILIQKNYYCNFWLIIFLSSNLRCTSLLIAHTGRHYCLGHLGSAQTRRQW